MPRALCHNCDYPVATCVCDWVSPYNNKIKLTILQHPNEVNHAKNTVKLISLATKNIEILVGETPEDFADLKNQIEAAPLDFALLYPSEHAQVINQSDSTRPANLIVIDGTWRKAKKIYLSNPWLDAVPHLMLKSSSRGEYAIRKTSIEGGLSTLEAVAMALESIDNTPTSPLIKLFNGFQSRFMQQMPDKVQSRYNKNGD